MMGTEELKTKRRTSPLICGKELGSPLLAHCCHHLLQSHVTYEDTGTTDNLDLAILLSNQLCSQDSLPED
ncbi:hypothetical protein I79_017324 [Cricetulus griseus]|uniref:Uncharacterized protein n=1 Tax=Cricetulus griseus TaxID=10029 RepID=G3I1Q9_CRIGR|nr:hypothetical protein I79_017324 [Cricetulus griseus]